ncbi:MAG TPA: PIG-L deacetylase family protein [Terriglobales bacterium]|nr:PIG-L deacetylase family protein [Terriglobales bacterium]
MRRRGAKGGAFFLLAGLPLLVAAAGLAAQADPGGPGPVPGDRVLVLAPHPDDETLGCGGIIQKAVALNLPVRVVFLTYGDDNEWSFLIYRKFFVYGSHAVEKMGLVRDGEARQAAAKLGLRADEVTFLGYPDHALQSIWYDHWSGQPPAVGPLSRAREVPYPDAYRPGAPYRGDDIVRDLRTILQDFKPTKVFLSHPADNHPDHRSLYVFTRVALWDVYGDAQGPPLFPYLVHFSGWPEHSGLHESWKLNPAPALRDGIRWVSEALDEREVKTKLEALRQHKSQHEAGAPFLDAFVRENELFGDFPDLTVGRESAGSEAAPVQVQGDRLLIAVEVPPSDVEKAHFSFGIFGYRCDVPFAQMPKLRIRFSARDHLVLDKGRELDNATIEVRKENARLVVALPLEALGHPQKILLGTRAPLSVRPVGYFSWRIIVLPQAGPGPGQGR